MSTAFSHVIQSRFSRHNEDVATEALGFVLSHSADARDEFTRVLSAVIPELPALTYRTQQHDQDTRPDIAGAADGQTRILIENKFWAGLTSHQPVDYLRSLARSSVDTALIFVVPDARVHTIWRELLRRLSAADVEVTGVTTSGVFAVLARTSIGPAIAVTSWISILDRLSAVLSHDQLRREDISQLSALCQAADVDAFIPMSSEELSDHRTPGSILQLSAVAEEAVERGKNEQLVNTDRLLPQSSRERIGRYVRFPAVTYFWFGLHFALWKQQGESPLWMVFYSGEDVSKLERITGVLDGWAERENVMPVWTDGAYALPIPVKPKVEKHEVVVSIVGSWRSIWNELSKLSSSV